MDMDMFPAQVGKHYSRRSLCTVWRSVVAVVLVLVPMVDASPRETT